MMEIDYKSAGVDIAAGNEAVKHIKKMAVSTFSSQVLTGIGSFASMYDLLPLVKEYNHPVLVQSVDGVGTKMMVARMMGEYRTIGIDLVSATTNDILVLGAKPLTLLDYIANEKLDPRIITDIVSGIVLACKEHGIALVGGETAEMPGVYRQGEIDLVGIITGVVEKERVIMGDAISEGDLILAFHSSGLHTNGYSLARKLFFEIGKFTVDTYLDDLASSVGEALLSPHLNYTQPIHHLLTHNIPIKGMAHITGGGLLENIPRILPANCAAEIRLESIPSMPIFSILQNLGNLGRQEMYRTFNMGIGMVVIIAPEYLASIHSLLHALPLYPIFPIGTIIKGQQEVILR